MWLNLNNSTKDASSETDLSQEIRAPSNSHVKKRVINKVVTRITVEKEDENKNFGKIEAMFKNAHSIKELEKIAADTDCKDLIVSERKTIFDYLRRLADELMQIFIES